MEDFCLFLSGLLLFQSNKALLHLKAHTETMHAQEMC